MAVLWCELLATCSAAEFPKTIFQQEDRMFCPKCGASNQADASFCYKCGASITGKAPEQVRYEICQIEGEQVTKPGLGEFAGRTFRFWADAVAECVNNNETLR